VRDKVDAGALEPLDGRLLKRSCGGLAHCDGVALGDSPRRTSLDRRRAVALVVLLPWLAWALVRGLALDRFWPLVLVVGFTPWAALTAPLPVLAALALRRFGLAALALAVAAVLAAFVVPRGLGSNEPAGGRPTITVMTANLLVGRADVGAVLDRAARERVDVLVLEEATEDALDRIDRLPGRAALPRRATDRRFNAILTRPGLRPRFGSAAGDVAVRLTVAGRKLRVVAVHPEPPVTEPQIASWRADLRALPPARGPLPVLAGDFNATLDHRELRDVLDRGYRDAADVTGDGLRPTWPDGRRRPPITIDHVLADRRLGVRRTAVHDVPGSDHHAVVAELILP